MAKYRLVVGSRSVSLSTDLLKQFLRLDLTAWSRAILYLAPILLACFAIIYPVWEQISSESWLYLVVYLVLWLGAMTLVRLLIHGVRVLIDPPLFMTILAFVFVSLISLLFTPANSVNTFGQGYYAYLSGIAMLAMLSLYYLGVLSIRSAGNWQLVTRGYAVGLFLYFLASLLWPERYFELSNVLQLVLPSLLLLSLRLESGRDKWLIALALVLLTLWQVRLDLSPLVRIMNVVSMLWLALSLPILSGTTTRQLITDLKADIATWRKAKISVAQLLMQNWLAVGLIGLTLLMVMNIALALGSNFDLLSLIESTVTRYSRLLANSSLTALLFGEGLVSLFSQQATAVNIIRGQGLIGLAAYLILGLGSIYYIVQRVQAELATKKLGVSTILSPFIFAVPLAGFVTSLSFGEILAWWMAIIIITSRHFLELRHLELEPVIKSIRLRKLTLPRPVLWQWVGVLVIIALLVVLLQRLGPAI